MASIFYKTGGAFSGLTPLKIVAFQENYTASAYDALNIIRTQAFTASEAGDMEGAVIAIRLLSNSAAQSITLKLQENVASVWTDRATVTRTYASLKGTHNYSGTNALLYAYFEFAAPYTITTAAGTWRLSVSSTDANALWIKSGSTYIHAIVLTTATVYAASDNIWLNDEIAVTINQSITANLLIPCVNVHISWENPPVASYTLTVTEFYITTDTYFQVGSSVIRIPYAQQATLNITNMRHPAGFYGAQNSEIYLYGEKPTNYKTTFAANAASGQKIIVTADDMSASWVGTDTLILYGYNHSTAYPISYVINTIVGTTVNVTVNLTYQHFKDWVILNWTRAQLCGIKVTTSTGNVIAPGQAVRFEVSGVVCTPNATNFIYVPTYSTNLYDLTRVQLFLLDTIFTKTGVMVSIPNVSNFYVSSFLDIYYWNSAFNATLTMTSYQSIFTNIYSASGSNPPLTLTSISSAITNLQCIGSSGSNALDIVNVHASTFTNVKSLGGARALRHTGNVNTFINSSFDKGTSYSVLFNGISDIIFTNCDFGQDAASGIADFSVDTGILTKALLKSCSDFIVENTINTNALEGSFIKAHQYDAIANDHRSWFLYGNQISVGDGLADTTRHTTGTGKFALRFEPLSSTNALEWEFLIPTGDISTKTMTVACWVMINNAAYYAGTHQKPKLTINYDDGTLASTTALGNTDWQLLAVNFTPATTFGEITVTIDGYTDAVGSNAYFYIDDFVVLYPPAYVLNLGGMDLWANALPITPPIATVFSAQDVWTAQTAVMTGAGSIGKLLVDDIDMKLSDLPTAVEIRTEMDSNSVDLNSLIVYVDELESRLTAARAGYLDNLSVGAVALQASVDDLEGRLSAARALLLDNLFNLDTPISGIQADTDDIQTRLPAALVGGRMAANAEVVGDKIGYALSASGVDAIHDEVVEGSYTMRQLMRIMASALFGKASGGGTVTITFRDLGDTKDRIVATVDANGNRSVVVLDGT